MMWDKYSKVKKKNEIFSGHLDHTYYTYKSYNVKNNG